MNLLIDELIGKVLEICVCFKDSEFFDHKVLSLPIQSHLNIWITFCIGI